MANNVTFEANEQNVLAVIQLVKQLERVSNKSSVEIVKKYTEGKCSTLAGLINHFVPESQIHLAATVENDGFTIKFYHYMIKLAGKTEKEDCYYDINGRIPAKDLPTYCSSLLKEPDKSKIYYNDVNNKIHFGNYDPVINKCVNVINSCPEIITEQAKRQQKSR